MLKYPQIDPVAFHLGPLPVHWYGIMYLVGFLAAWLLLNWRAKHSNGLWNKEQVSDLIFYGAMGVIIGGRIGYMLFYDFSSFVHQPWIIVKIWDGGMSFHGGLLGVLVALLLFAKRYQKNYFDVTDYLAPVVPIGLGAGRIGNFINGELWGRVTDAPWGMVYPQAGNLPRHPSELYEFLLEGVLLFLILWCYSNKPRPRLAVSSLFLLGYGLFRFFCEFFRQPDIQLGYLAGNWLTMGQILSIPMIIIGLVLLVVSYRRSNL